MKGRKILGIMVAMAIVLTAIPTLSGNAKAESSNTEHVPSYLVLVRKGYDDVCGYTINKMIGNAYQNDFLGVEIIVHVKDYTYRPSDYDEVCLNVIGVGVKGSSELTQYYRIKWLRIDVTKFTYEPMDSSNIPRATDYYSALDASPDYPISVYGLHGWERYYDGDDNNIDWLCEISGAVAGTIASIATAEGGVLASALIGTAASELLVMA